IFSDGRIWMRDEVGTNLMSSAVGTYPNDGQFHHIALVYDEGLASGSRSKIYVDGTEVALVNNNDLTGLGSDDLYIGHRPLEAPAFNFDGEMDFFRIWDNARTSTEINNNLDTELVSPQTNLVASWNFLAGDGSFLWDLSGNQHSGELVNMTTSNRRTSPGITAITDTPQNALAVDGSGDYVTIPYSADLNPSVFTVEAWAKVSGSNSTFRSVISSRDRNGSTVAEGFVLYASDMNEWEFWTGDGVNPGWNIITGPPVVNDQWTHLAGVYDGTNMNFYINGALVGTLAVPYAPQDAIDAVIGAGNEPIAFPFNGQIDEVRIWNIARTQQEIIDNAYSSLTAGPAVSYTFNNSSGDAIDAVAGNDGTLIGNTSYVASTAFDADVFGPLPVITSSESGTTSLAPFPVTVTFNESVADFVASDITVTNGELLNFSGSGTNYSADIYAIATGTVEVDVNAGVATDASGNSNVAANTFSINANFPENALSFTGGDHYVDLGDINEVDLASE
ncbi:MAG: hypothetical protein HRT61_25135, partial [Ekhidna sp.]|nr:hypothetical protein [Ekhidna sp.]